MFGQMIHKCKQNIHPLHDDELAMASVELAFLCSAPRAISPQQQRNDRYDAVCVNSMLLISQKQINNQIYANNRSRSMCRLSAQTKRCYMLNPLVDQKTQTQPRNIPPLQEVSSDSLINQHKMH